MKNPAERFPKRGSVPPRLATTGLSTGNVDFKFHRRTWERVSFCYTLYNIIFVVNQDIILLNIFMELIALRIPPELKERIERLAQEQHRPLSNMIRLMLIEWLDEHDSKPSTAKK